MSSPLQQKLKTGAAAAFMGLAAPVALLTVAATAFPTEALADRPGPGCTSGPCGTTPTKDGGETTPRIENCRAWGNLFGDNNTIVAGTSQSGLIIFDGLNRPLKLPSQINGNGTTIATCLDSLNICARLPGAVSARAGNHSITCRANVEKRSTTPRRAAVAPVIIPKRKAAPVIPTYDTAIIACQHNIDKGLEHLLYDSLGAIKQTGQDAFMLRDVRAYEDLSAEMKKSIPTEFGDCSVKGASMGYTVIELAPRVPDTVKTTDLKLDVKDPVNVCYQPFPEGTKESDWTWTNRINGFARGGDCPTDEPTAPATPAPATSAPITAPQGNVCVASAVEPFNLQATLDALTPEMRKEFLEAYVAEVAKRAMAPQGASGSTCGAAPKPN